MILRNFSKVEKWTRDGMKVDGLLYAGNNLDKARRIVERTTSLRKTWGGSSRLL